jgi:trans-aconitate methyltransferase
VADVFIDRLDVRPVSRWVDVGCGTGAVTQTVLTRCEPASILGVDPSETFLEVARSSIDDPRASFEVADAASIPLADDGVDAAVSGLVLNFVPDPVEMLSEMRRVTHLGGIVAIYVWDYGDGMQIMRHFWDAATSASMTEVADPRHQHRPLQAIDGIDRLVVAHRAAGLGERADAGRKARLDRIREWEERVAGAGRPDGRQGTEHRVRLGDRLAGGIHP